VGDVSTGVIYHKVIDINDGSSQSRILKLIRSNSRVLEFGCSTGFMTQYLTSELGCHVTCLEIDSGAAALARPHAAHLLLTDLDAMTWPEALAGETFDYVLFADVLEHLKDPWAVLKAATAFLAEDGHVITSLPNVAHPAVIAELINGRFTYGPWGLLDKTHLRFFTRASVEQLLLGAGLTPLHWEAMVLKPSQTEFAENLKRSPLILKLWLRLMGLKNDYQFITVSSRT
jgi:2-polyprenyl-3-methyl-5-hydroxy-6-metoxy-1,4-benzoquinol methylase